MPNKHTSKYYEILYYDKKSQVLITLKQITDTYAIFQLLCLYFTEKMFNPMPSSKYVTSFC